jgi:alcohol dehydrogenase class IV
MIDFVVNRQVLVGKDTIDEIGEILKWNEKKKVLLVVYNQNADCVKKIIDSIVKSGMEYSIYDKIQAEPDLEVIDNGVALCLEENCDSVVAVGGGSVIDASKTIAMIAANGGKTIDYQLGGKEVEKLPLFYIAVPTTAGTGAEATKVSVIYNKEKGWKKAIYHTSMIAQTAILDPMTTVGLPPKVTVFTGIDAITHAIESYVSVFSNEVSKMYSLKALKLLADNIVKVYNDPNDIQARENMLLGSYFAGCAISVGTCLAHIVGQPMGAIHKISHGEACSICLIPSMELNLEYALEEYAEIAKVLGVKEDGKKNKEIALEGIEKLRIIAKAINAPEKLTEYVSKDKIDVEYMLDNIQGSMGHIKTNPRPVSRELFKELIESVI